MVVGDRDIGEIALSQPEISQRAHEAIIDLAGRLLATPEFMKHLGLTFFSRGFPSGGKPVLKSGVLFPLGDFTYFVDYQAQPFRFNPEDRQIYNTTMMLGLSKFDPQSNFGLPLKLDSGSASSLLLETGFIEGPDGKVIEYRYGSAVLQDRELGDSYNTSLVFDRIPKAFSAFYQPIRL